MITGDHIQVASYMVMAITIALTILLFLGSFSRWETFFTKLWIGWYIALIPIITTMLGIAIWLEIHD